jgi:hypothetical protein
VRVGPWAFQLAIDAGAHFPHVENVLPAPSAVVTTCHLSPEDAAFLERALPRLPGRDDDSSPVTLDLGQQVILRARAQGQQRLTEIVLQGSEVKGPPMRLACNRRLLARALQLGFGELSLAGPEAPVVCREPGRTFGWMPLGKDTALLPSEDAVRITSLEGKQPACQPPKERSKPVLTTSSADGRSNGHAPLSHGASNGSGPAPNYPSGAGALIAEAQALHEALRDASVRTGRLVAALKRQRRQSKLASTALASLKLLQQIDV